MSEMSKTKTGIEAGRKSSAKIPLMMMARDIRPLGLLKEAIDNRDWFTGLVLSTTFFEMFGLMMLSSYFGRGKKDSEHRNIVADCLDRIGLMKLIQLLYLCGFVRLGTYRKMKSIVKERNTWIHRVKGGKKYLIDAEEKDIEKIMNLITDAINCLKELGLTH
jgi:hypothetical protein